MNKILITYGTRPLAQRVSKLLRSKFEILYCSNESIPDLLLKGDYRKIPTGVDPTFAHELLKLCLDDGCQYILPLGKMELGALHQARVLFKEYDIDILIPKNIDEVMILEQPETGLPLQIFQDGKDMLTDSTIDDVTFSGVGLLSDDQSSVVLCLV